jgi:hypothetical protein
MTRWLLAGVLLLAAIPARAQEGELQDIKVGSSRIGGPGLTEAERKANEYEGEDDTALTEETLPPKGNPKRLPGLHKIAARYARGQMWKDACARYDQIVEESGDEGMSSNPDAAAYAARAYIQCAEIEFRNHKFERTEVLLKQSEEYGPSDYRHGGLRRQMKRDTYREEVGKGNWDKALTVFRAYHAEKADEDERIWLGEQLAKREWEAYKAKDDVELQRAIADTESIAPMNAEHRKLKDKIHDEKTGLSRMLMLAVSALALAGFLGLVFRWRAKAKVADMEEGGGGGGLFARKNKFIDD